MMRLIIALTVAALAACSGPSSDSAVPRREAYPRAMHYAADYAYPPGLPMRFAANADATYDIDVKPNGDVWLSICYPAYDAWIYCTFTDLRRRDRDEAIANRLERMALNIGGATASMQRFMTPGGTEAQMLTARGVPMAPVQFIASDSLWMVSGNAVFRSASPRATADSLAPMVDVVRRDIEHALMGL